MLLKEVVKVGHLGKAQGMRNVGNRPGRMLQQDFGFAQNAIGDDLSGCFERGFPYSPVKVVDVDIELAGVLGGCPKLNSLMGVIDGELAFE